MKKRLFVLNLVFCLLFAPFTGTVFAAGKLIVEEYKIVAKEIDTPNRIEFGYRIPKETRNKRAKWRDYLEINYINQLNKKLEKTRYKIKAIKDRTYNLENGTRTVLDEIILIDRFSMSKNGKNFSFIAKRRAGGDVFVYNGTVDTDWDGMKHGFTAPIFIGNELAFINKAEEGNKKENLGDMVNFEIKKGKDTIYSFQAKSMISGYIDGYFNYKDDWVLEYQNNVVINGKNIGKENGFEQVFNYVILKDKPLYFFKKDGKIQISYNGEILSNSYDNVIHNECCERAAFNVRSNENMVWFFALKDGYWYYVEAGIYDK